MAESKLPANANDHAAETRHTNEQLLLFCLMVDQAARDEVLWKVRREWFYDQQHQVIVAAIQRLDEKREPVDPVLVATELSQRGELEIAGGIAYLCQLGERYTNAGLASYHTKVVREQWIKRQAKYAGIELVGMVNDDRTLEDIVEKCEATIGAVCETAVPQTVIGVSELIKMTMADITQRAKTGKRIGTPIGFADVDAVLGGISGGETIIIAARPGDGKTSFGCCITLNLCRAGKAVLFIALETSRLEWMTRMLSIESEVDGEVIASGMASLSREDREMRQDDLMQASTRLHGFNLHLDETANQPIRAIIGNARRHKRRFGLDVLVIDYLQLIEPENKGNVPREQQVATFSRKLKQLAKELNIPIIVLAQINREVEKRQSRRPNLSDLRESGSIEQDADKVMFIYREGRTEETTNSGGTKVFIETPGVAQISIAKNRNGRTHTGIELAWIPERTTFRDSSFRQVEVATRASNAMGNRNF